MAILHQLKVAFVQRDAPAITEGVAPIAMATPHSTANVAEKAEIAIANNDADPEMQKPIMQMTELGEEGAQRIELMQEVWGKHGKLYVLLSLAFCMIVYELDNTTYGTYYVYAVSDFNMIASSSALAVACNLTFSLMKPVWAKVSDIFGRGEMYPAAALFATLGFVAAASAQGFGAFAAGTVLRVVGITCLNTVNTIVIADITSTRQRAFGVNLQFWPYLILPWVSAYIVSAVVSPGGIGWAWGIGILAIIYPFGVVGIMSLLLMYQSRAKKLQEEYVSRARLSVYETPWIIVLMILGGLFLTIGLPIYESKVAAHPLFPVRYLKHKTICLAFLLYFTDYMAAAASHAYLYNWALIAQGLTIVQATNLSFINGVMTFVTGILLGLVMWKSRTYKWWIVIGLVIRVIGYGVMFRIRTSSHITLGELIVVQLIQGAGDGIVQTGGYVAATINVPHRETAQMAALMVMVGTLGASVGDAISGAIYTGTFREQLRKELGANSTPEIVEALFNSITTLIPEWGTPNRIAINTAYNNVTSFFYIAAMVIIVPGFILAWFLPNQVLTDRQNLLESNGMMSQRQAIRDTVAEGEDAVQRPETVPETKV